VRRSIILLLLLTPALFTLLPMQASAQQPGANDNVVYIVKRYDGPTPMAAGYNYSLLLVYNKKGCVLAQSNAQGQMGQPAAGAPPVQVAQQTLTNMWNNLTDPQWLPWIAPPQAVLTQIQNLP
jgi:hypothetical protein